MREAFVGFDSAWGGKESGGIVWASFDNGRLAYCDKPRMARFDDASQIILKLRADHDLVLVAIDQPTLVQNKTGARPVDRVAGSLISKLRSGVQPANRSKSALFGPNAPVWRFLKKINACQNPPVAQDAQEGLHLIEVFPALALPALEPQIFARKYAARYNPSVKRRKGKEVFSLCDWKLVANAVVQHSKKLGCLQLSQWAHDVANCDRPRKDDQDQLDAAICLIVALQWRRVSRECVAVIGDGQNGYMVTPVSAETKEILQHAATKKGVPFNEFFSWTPNSNRKDNSTHRQLSEGSENATLRSLLVEAARKGKLLIYSQVAKQLYGKPLTPQVREDLYAELDRIAEENQRRGEPLLPSLVVRKEDHLPGSGFFTKFCPDARGKAKRASRHAECIAAIRKFDWPD